MAYLRKENQTVETDYSLNKVWTAVPKALVSLEWSVEAIDERAHQVKAKTKAAFMSLSSVLLINVIPVSKNTTRISVAAETPVTTITSIADFAQGRRRITLFLSELANHLAKSKKQKGRNQRDT
jgi:hypothetical protein